MTRLQVAVISVVVALFMAIFVAVGLTGKIMLDGMGRNRARLAFQHAARMAWLRGDMVKAGKSLINGVQLSIEGGVRWQVANYYLEHSARLTSKGQLAEAVKACLAASEALGQYDSNWVVRRNCTDLFWKAQGYGTDWTKIMQTLETQPP